MNILKPAPGLVIGQPRFPAIRPLVLSDQELARNVLVSSPDADVRRAHMRTMLSHQARRGGDWVYFTSADDRKGVALLREDSVRMGRGDDFDLITLDLSSPGLEYTHSAHRCVGRAGRLCCVVLPPTSRLRKGGAELLRKLLVDLYFEMGDRFEALAGATALTMLIALDDIGLFEAMVEHPREQMSYLQPLVAAVERARGFRVGFVLGATEWCKSGHETRSKLAANSAYWIGHQDASDQDINTISRWIGVDLARKTKGLPADRFVLARLADTAARKKLPTVVSARFPRLVGESLKDSKNTHDAGGKKT